MRWAALLQPHRRRPLITATTITSVTATMVTDNTQVTTGENITALTVAKPWAVPRRLRQMRPRATKREASFPCGQVRHWADAEAALAAVLGILARQYSYC